ncbi:ParB/RepB/Spo0J family partition protein [Plastoroseomonas arctica]|uniref:ParB/RepB/Spo0J family partition protein n=1 Tax=Plastoroseomonas arctica TaxID=1509237 RepID=A0AAF1K3R8_9PROT|nr:ParB/RepB/Spo0J family partition protein [Plastoroseomonas arctica]MBR0655235.1 ParB/RepB/Spo0J family partition protein [Plastoroseomonas arctica]
MSGKKPPRLGMGLSALMGEAVASTPTATRSLPIEALEPGPFQPRGPIDPADLEELTGSIREHGILQPILVRPKPGDATIYQIIGGERRWRAAQLARLHEVPVLIRDFDDRTAMAAALVENLQREDLNAIEEAEGYSRLTEQFGLTQESLGKAVGKSRSHVANTLRLLNLSSHVRDLLRDGHLTAGHARALLTAAEPEKLANQIIARGLNVRQAEALAAGRGPSVANHTMQRQDADAAALERTLTEALGLKVRLAASGAGGSLTISYRTLDQLDGLVRLLQPDT